MHLVLFDLDHTLLNGDSDVSWNRFLIDKGLLDRETYHETNERFYADYAAGRLDIHAYLNFALDPLARYPRAQLDALHREFMETVIRPMITPRARAEAARHKADGHKVVIITATNRFVTAPIAAELGVEHLIATEPEEIDGVFTGKSSGTPCYQEGKVVRLNEWLAAQGLTWESFEETWFYSDSRNDLPLLQRVDHPIAVDPDPVLRAHAENAGWQVISLRA